MLALDAFRDITLALAGMSVQFGALVSVFIVYSSEQLTFRSKSINEPGGSDIHSPMYTFYVVRLSFLQFSCGISALILVVAPLIVMVFMIMFPSEIKVVMYCQLSLFTLGTCILVYSLYKYFIQEILLTRTTVNLASMVQEA